MGRGNEQPFELWTMGRLELRVAGGDVVQKVQARPKDLALLAFLACRSSNGLHRRDAVVALLWPDLEQSHSRNALSQALHRLRSALSAEVIVTRGREEVGVDPVALWCDAVAFDRCLAQGDLSGALSLCAGDFVAGFHLSGASVEFENWVYGERARLQRAAFNAALVLADVEETSGTPGGAVQWLDHAAEVRPLDESVLRRQMKALAASNAPADALRLYENFKRRLADEYGLAPSRETEALCRSIGNGGSPSPRRAYRPPRGIDDRVVAAYLKGRYFTSTVGDSARGLEHLSAALEMDPDYAPAHAARALALAHLALLGVLHPSAARIEVENEAQRALDLDRRSSEGHTAVAAVRMMFDWDWTAAERELVRALECNEDSVDAQGYFAVLLCAAGRQDEGIEHARAGQRLDPLGMWSNFILGWALYRGRRFDASIAQLSSLLELYPQVALAHLFLGENHLHREALGTARESCRAAVGLLPQNQLVRGIAACVIGLAGEHETARQLLDSLQAEAKRGYVGAGFLAAAHLGVGDESAAFASWDAMCAERSPLAFLVPTDPLYDCVRDDPRFDAMRRQLDFPRTGMAREKF